MGIILAVTVGFGIAVFYPQPTSPNYSSGYKEAIPEICNKTPTEKSTVECQNAILKQEEVQKKYDEEFKIFQNKNARYTRTSVFFGIVMGALFVMIGLSFTKTSKIVANGFLLSGILTAIFTRMLISIASLGSQVSSTGKTDNISLIEFIVLLVLSVGVFLKGVFGLKEEK